MNSGRELVENARSGRTMPAAALALAAAMTAMLLAGRGASAQNFLAPKSFSVGTSPYALTTADFNGDGRPDIATANEFGMHSYGSYAGSVSVLNGLGGQDFSSQVEYPVRRTGGYGYTCPNGITAGDFNKDGLPDVAVANYFNTITVFCGQAGGTFGLPVNYDSGNGTHSIVTSDFNKDGLPDLAATNIYSNDITVLYGQSAGGFGNRQNLTVGAYPEGLVAADLNGDGLVDLASANHDSNNVTVLYGQASGGFAAGVSYAVGTNPRGVTSADFNRDGLPDLAVSNRASKTVSVLYGQSNGTFGSRHDYPVGENSWGLASADFNEDGLPDLAIANEQYSNSITVYYGLAAGGFGDRIDIKLMTVCLPRDVIVGDFDGNGGVDIATSAYWNDKVYVIYNTIPEPATVSLLALCGLVVIRRGRGRLGQT